MPLPLDIHRILEPYYYRLRILPKIRSTQRDVVHRIQKRGIARIAFIVSSFPMWRAQSLYNQLKEDSRFQVIMVINPFWRESVDQKEKIAEEFRTYFEQEKMPFADLSNEQSPGKRLRELFDPDILFYPQPYNDLFGNDIDNKFFTDKLICYIPYGMLTIGDPWVYKNHLSNIAWRLYLSSEDRKSEAKSILLNKGKNIRITGDLMVDYFSQPTRQDPWKIVDHKRKRIIWAPHFSIMPGDHLQRNSFVSLSSTMLEMVEIYKDTIQFAFKPHPRLKHELYKHPDWGVEKTNEYYRRWEAGNNTQLEEGSYIDLFNTSDAMIHDCGSFSVEYLFTEKPVMFVSSDINNVTRSLNDFGAKALFAHYQGARKEDIIHFIDSVVLKGEDPMREQRAGFHKRYLTSPTDKSVADNIYQDLIRSLGFEK